MHSDQCSDLFRSSFSGIPDFPRNFRIPAEHTPELNHSRARLICSGIPDSGIPAGIPDAFYATCNKHSACGLKNNTKSRCQHGILLAAASAPHRKPATTADGDGDGDGDAVSFASAFS